MIAKKKAWSARNFGSILQQQSTISRPEMKFQTPVIPKLTRTLPTVRIEKIETRHLI